MEVTAVILYNDAFAYYSVVQETNTVFTAHLFSYSGERFSMPPSFIRAEVQEGGMKSNISDVSLVNDILRAARLEQDRKESSLPGNAERVLPVTNRWF
jgi:hypothetical protein